MRCQLALFLALTLLFSAATTMAQRRGSGHSDNFDSGPEIGEELPDVTALDENGQKISLRSLRGKYTVLVFGCLT